MALTLILTLIAGGAVADEFNHPRPSDVPRLIRHLEDPGVRLGAADALVALGPAAVEGLTRALDAPQADVRIWSADTLGRIGPPASASWPKLVEALESDDVDLRAAAATALGHLRAADKPVVRSLVARLADTDAGVRRASARSLGRLGDATAAAPLVKLLADQPARRGALEALEQLGKPVVPLLLEALADDLIRLEAADVLRRVDPAAAARAGVVATTEADLAALRLSLDNPDKDVEARVDAANRLGPFGLAAAPDLIRALTDANPYVSRAAVAALGVAGPAALEPVCQALADPSPPRRAAAADAIAAMGKAAESAVPDLARALRDTDRTVRHHAARALDTLGPVADAAVDALVATVHDARELEATRQLAIKALGQTSVAVRPRVIEALAESTGDSNYGVKKLAEETLEKLRAK